MAAAELPIWVVYDRPRDFPNCYVARLWMGETMTDNIMLSTNLDDIRSALERRGLVKLMRHPEDDAHILETWL